ncbi:MAG: FAD-binding protein [Myxococcota bacterium]|nr:FAD-binding protein [Myxococcota bacterium]
MEIDADIIIIGMGAAGVCAALEASVNSGDVLVVDRFRGGGTSAISGGIVYAGGGTGEQREAGFDDAPEEMFNYLKCVVGDAVLDNTLRRFCEESAANLEWLKSHGVPFHSHFCEGKTSYPLDQFGLYYSGDELSQPYRAGAKPAPRGHRVKGKGMPGKRFFVPLWNALKRRGVRTYLQTKANSVKQDDDGQWRIAALTLSSKPVVALLHWWAEKWAIKLNNYVPTWSKKLRRFGAYLESRHGEEVFLRAKKSLIMTTGGFIYNRVLVRQYAPKYRPGMPLGTGGDQGSALVIAKEIGAMTKYLDRVSAWRFINPPRAFTSGLLVNTAGERYVSEEFYGATIGYEMVEHNQGRSYLIIDETLKREAREQVRLGKSQWFQMVPTLLNLWFNAKRSSSLSGLAKSLRIDPEGLKKTVREYNDRARTSGDDVFGKERNHFRPLEGPPYYGIDCSIDSRKFPCPTLTLGGISVDEDTGQVLAESGEPMRGLYAAGRAAVGVCSRQYVSGLSLADCVFSGRRAGYCSTRVADA